MMSGKPQQYVTVVESVLEVSLRFEAQAGPWAALLQANDVPIVPQTERVQVILSGVQARFMGVRFRELSISVQLTEADYYLAHAFNSVRPFAWAERQFFRTPYYHADIALSETSITLRRAGQVMLDAALSPGAKMTSEQGEVDLLKLYLPKALRKDASVSHYFDARLEGASQHFDIAGADYRVEQAGDVAALKAFDASEPVLRDWFVRRQAKHSKSATKQTA
jgi:hypothetical protein